jgi:hypothetical protein
VYVIDIDGEADVRIVVPQHVSKFMVCGDIAENDDILVFGSLVKTREFDVVQRRASVEYTYSINAWGVAKFL